MLKRSSFIVCSVVLISQAAPAREGPGALCGTHGERAAEEAYLHKRSESRRGISPAVRLKALAARAASGNIDVGDIAVIDDSDGVVAQPNAFDLRGKTVAFLPSNGAATRYRVAISAESYDAAAATAGAKLASLGDDDAAQTYLAFEFPYYGARYRTLWVNSDGNLTFGTGDGNSTDRTLGRLTGGPPRIAPLLTDLDPSQARGTNGVRVLHEPGRTVVSWSGVPVYSDTGGGVSQTFQVRLYPDGRIEMTYTSVNISEAVTGIGPGRLQGGLAIVPLASGPGDEFAGAVADRFSNSPSIDIATVAQKFYATHEDAYDYLVIYNSVGVMASPTAVAYEVTVRSQRAGIGDVAVDRGGDYGSPRRLQSVLNMGPLYQYPDDVNAVLPSRRPAGDTTLTVLAHETGHLFLAFASVRDPGNPTSLPMLGRSLVHWSFNFNSEASYLEGTRIQDQGPGVSPRFKTVATVQQYSPLDQYLMGFRSKDEVPPTFLVSGSPYSNSTFPQAGIQFDGTRRDITVDDLIAVEGRRTPDSTVAQRRFRFAFILISPSGSAPPASQVAKVESIRAAYESFYQAGTSDRAAAETGLRRAVQLSASPAAGLLVNGTGEAILALQQAASSPLTFELTVTGGTVRTPATVTIPAGADKAAFQLQGLAEGVSSLTAKPSDGSYETGFARIQVRAAGAALTLKLVGGSSAAAGPLQVRVTDVNEVPYAGVRVAANVSAGTLDRAVAVTGSDGLANFRWSAASGVATLRAAIEGAPETEIAVALIGRPVIGPDGIVNGASFGSGITPGSFATIFGAGLAGGVRASLLPPLPFGTQGVQVWINGMAAQLSYVSDSQINLVVPWGLSGSSAKVEIDNPAGHFDGFSAPILAVSPGVFFGGNNLGAVLVSGTGLTTDVRPAKVGETLEIYATGLGAVTGSTAYPGLQETVILPRVLIGNVAADGVVSVLSPQFPGLYQVNARVAAGTPAGDQTLTVVMGGVRSNPVRVRIGGS